MLVFLALVLGGLSVCVLLFSTVSLQDAAEQGARCFSVDTGTCGSASDAMLALDGRPRRKPSTLKGEQMTFPAEVALEGALPVPQVVGRWPLVEVASGAGRGGRWSLPAPDSPHHPLVCALAACRT